MKKYLIVTTVTFLLAWNALERAPAADLFSRYHQDQPTANVHLDGTRLLGTRQGENVYLAEREIIEMALSNNLSINIMRQERLSRFWEIEQGKRVYDPAVQLGFNWDREVAPSASVLAGGDSVTDILTSYSGSYRQAFSTGTTLEANFVGSRNRTTNFFASLVPAIHSQFEVLLRQNLLRGFGRIAEDYQIEISRTNLDISEQEFWRTALDVVLEAQDRYWELQYARKDLEVRVKAVELAEATREQNEARFEVGTASRLDVVQAEAEVALRREELIRSQYHYRQVQDELVRLITQYEDPREFTGRLIPIEPVQSPSPLSESFDRLVQQALELRPAIQQAQLQSENRRTELDLSRDRLKPTLDFVAGYQQFGLGGRQVIRDFSEDFVNPPIIDIIPGGLRDSLTDLFSADFYGYVVGLDLQLPIFNRDARAANAQAQIALRRSELEEKNVRQMVQTEIRNALTQIEMNRERLETVAVAVRSAQERLEAEQARFDVGMGTTRDLIEAQRDLAQAESVEVRAEIDLIKSHDLLDRAVGWTLSNLNIVMRDSVQENVVGSLPEPR